MIHFFYGLKYFKLKILKCVSKNKYQWESYANVDSLTNKNCGSKCKDHGKNLKDKVFRIQI